MSAVGYRGPLRPLILVLLVWILLVVYGAACAVRWALTPVIAPTSEPRRTAPPPAPIRL